MTKVGKNLPLSGEVGREDLFATAAEATDGEQAEYPCFHLRVHTH